MDAAEPRQESIGLGQRMIETGVRVGLIGVTLVGGLALFGADVLSFGADSGLGNSTDDMLTGRLYE